MRKLFGDGRGFLTSWPLGFTIAYNFFFYWLLLFRREWGLNVTLFEIAYLVPIVLSTNNKSGLFYIKVALAIVLTFFIWIRADFIVRTLSLLTIIGLNVIVFQEARTGKLVSSSYLIQLPLIWLEKFVFYTKRLFKFLTSWHVKIERFKKFIQAGTIKRVLVGVLFSIPILFILIVLFSSADRNFQDIFVGIFDRIKSIFNFGWLKNFNWIDDFIIQFGLLWLYLCLVFPYQDTRNQGEVLLTKQTIEKVTIGFLVGAVFAIFIATQAKSVSFILDGFTTGKINPGVFVREGFFQLLIACLVGLGVFHILKKDMAKSFLTLFLLIEVFLVSLVAGERVWLYQYQYGLTQARVWGIFSLLFIFALIITLFLNLKNKVDNQLKWQIYLLSFSFLLFGAGVINIDHLIATFRPPIVEGKIDVRYMANNLSWDAADLWVKGLKDIEAEDLEYKYNLAVNLNLYLANLENFRNTHGLDIHKICNQKDKGWLSYNISISNNRKQICQNHQNWMNFKREYELSHGIQNISNNFVVSSPQPFRSCYTLNTKMIVGADGKGQIGCDIEVDGQIDLSKSYCESQKTQTRKSLVPDGYQRPNRYYATLAGLDLNEEVNVFVYTSTGSRVECLPSLNKKS